MEEWSETTERIRSGRSEMILSGSTDDELDDRQREDSPGVPFPPTFEGSSDDSLEICGRDLVEVVSSEHEAC